MELNFAEVVQRHAAERSDKLAVTLLDGRLQESVRMTYGELDRAARSLAQSLQLEVAPGERVLLLFGQEIAFAVGFLGCLYAGAVPVPLPLPARTALDATLGRIASVARSADTLHVLATDAVIALVPELLRALPALDRLRFHSASALLARGVASDFVVTPRRPDDLAFLQYTSGSTANPKGVMVTHANLTAHMRLLEGVWGGDSDDVSAGWLPMFHDLGLVGGFLYCLNVGCHGVVASPVTFLKRPAIWLEMVTRYRATMSGAPDFAYALCAAAVSERDKAALDLSSWRIAISGGEVVRAETVEGFCAAFAGCGFQRGSFRASYGLAEATLFVSADRSETAPELRAFDREQLEHGVAVPALAQRPSRVLVSCGTTGPGHTARVVDPATLAPLPDGRIGELWFEGPSVTAGYLGLEQANERVFRARLANDHSGFLRTGDLGFVRDGALFITGRIKDLIIADGRNHHPEDIEESVESAHSLLKRPAAVFSLEHDGRERVVAAVGIVKGFRASERWHELQRAVRSRVAAVHGLALHDVVLIPQGVPKTTSGKPCRARCKELYLRGQLKGLVALPALVSEAE
jgi:acyl-CoA synthetase (AMP-forming)/AMP-acid ligase II